MSSRGATRRGDTCRSLPRLLLRGAQNRLPQRIFVLALKRIEYAIYLSLLVITLGIFLVIGLYVRESVLALASLLLVFMAAMIIGSLNGTLNSCGCFSIKPSNPESLFLMLTRDILLLFGFLILYKNRLKNQLPHLP